MICSWHTLDPDDRLRYDLKKSNLTCCMLQIISLHKKKEKYHTSMNSNFQISRRIRMKILKFVTKFISFFQLHWWNTVSVWLEVNEVLCLLNICYAVTMKLLRELFWAKDYIKQYMTWNSYFYNQFFIFVNENIPF